MLSTKTRRTVQSVEKVSRDSIPSFANCISEWIGLRTRPSSAYKPLEIKRQSVPLSRSAKVSLHVPIILLMTQIGSICQRVLICVLDAALNPFETNGTNVYHRHCFNLRQTKLYVLCSFSFISFMAMGGSISLTAI